MKTSTLFSLLVMISMQVIGQEYNELSKYLNSRVTGKRSPGVQFIIADASGILFEYNKGQADISSEKEVSPTTQFKMYSSTKLLTMMGIMQLVEQGKISLDEPIASYLPCDFSKEVTVRRVLSHTAGFTKYPFIKEIHLTEEHDTFDYSTFITQMLPKHNKVKAVPGTTNHYSNYGYLVLSALIEEISGQDYEAYIQQHIIQPSGLKGEDYVGFSYTGLTATGYQKRRTVMHWLYSLMVDRDKYYGTKTNDWQAYENLYIDGIGFGGGFANARGLATLFVKVMDKHVISGQSLATTFEPQYYKKRKEARQALGWWHGEVNGHQSYSHAGGGGGYSCEVRIYPNKGIVRIMMMNKTQTVGDLKLFSTIDELWLR